MTYPTKRLPPWFIVQRTYGMAPLLWALWGTATLFACSSDESSPNSDGANNGGSAAHSGSAGSTGMSGGQAAGTSPGGSGGSVTHPRCWSERGAVMVEIPAPDGSTYCMDTTEATRGHYAEFLKASPDGKTAKDDVCPTVTGLMPRWEPHYDGDPNDPDTHVGVCYMEDYHGDNALAPVEADKPMTCISYCQARAYCEWAGKRLCGRIGGGSVKIGNTSVEPYDASIDEWYNACSQGGTQKYAYGNEYDSSACITSEGVDATVAENAILSVASKQGCRGTKTPFDRVYDLIGNVYEWTNACSLVQAGASMQMACVWRGSSPKTSEPAELQDCARFLVGPPSSSGVDAGGSLLRRLIVPLPPLAFCRVGTVHSVANLIAGHVPLGIENHAREEYRLHTQISSGTLRGFMR